MFSALLICGVGWEFTSGDIILFIEARSAENIWYVWVLGWRHIENIETHFMQTASSSCFSAVARVDSGRVGQVCAEDPKVWFLERSGRSGISVGCMPFAASAAGELELFWHKRLLQNSVISVAMDVYACQAQQVSIQLMVHAHQRGPKRPRRNWLLQQRLHCKKRRPAPCQEEQGERPLRMVARENIAKGNSYYLHLGLTSFISQGCPTDAYLT